MKIAICSDLHLEFGAIEFKNRGTEEADVLILSGDILIAEDLIRHPTNHEYGPLNSDRYVNSVVYRDFFDMVNYEFPTVIYIAGNHEFYGCKWNKTLDALHNTMENYTNIHFLEDESIKIKDVTFIGSTLWTDMNAGDPLTQHITKTSMNDFRQITNEDSGYSKLRPIHTIGRHIQSKNFIKKTVDANPNEKYVVCTHHAPSFHSIPLEYRSQHQMNGAYASNLEDFILDRPQIKLWTHGHTHDEQDYMIGDTRVFCNPRGYRGYESQANRFSLKYVDVV